MLGAGILHQIYMFLPVEPMCGEGDCHVNKVPTVKERAGAVDMSVSLKDKFETAKGMLTSFSWKSVVVVVQCD